MATFFQIIQIVSGVILIGLIILQAKGAGLGSLGGGEINFYSTKRGAEKVIFITTIIVAIIFLSCPLIGLFIR